MGCPGHIHLVQGEAQDCPGSLQQSFPLKQELCPQSFADGGISLRNLPGNAADDKNFFTWLKRESGIDLSLNRSALSRAANDHLHACGADRRGTCIGENVVLLVNFFRIRSCMNFFEDEWHGPRL